MTISNFTFALLIVAGWSANAQTNTSADGSKPVSANVPGAQFPKVDSGRRAHFRIAAPDTKEIAAGLSGGRRQLISNQFGV